MCCSCYSTHLYCRGSQINLSPWQLRHCCDKRTAVSRPGSNAAIQLEAYPMCSSESSRVIIIVDTSISFCACSKLSCNLCSFGRRYRPSRVLSTSTRHHAQRWYALQCSAKTQHRWCLHHRRTLHTAGTLYVPEVALPVSCARWFIFVENHATNRRLVHAG